MAPQLQHDRFGLGGKSFVFLYIIYIMNYSTIYGLILWRDDVSRNVTSISQWKLPPPPSPRPGQPWSHKALDRISEDPKTVALSPIHSYVFWQCYRIFLKAKTVLLSSSDNTYTLRSLTAHDGSLFYCHKNIMMFHACIIRTCTPNMSIIFGIIIFAGYPWGVSMPVSHFIVSSTCSKVHW